jgi:DNA-binding beta-propeller fold protein YncE
MPDNAPILTYEISSTPAVIHASPDSGEDSVISLSIRASNKTSPRQAVECKSIKIDFPKGNGAQHLFWDEDDITVTAPTDWTLTQHKSSFTATPKNSQAQSLTNSVLLQLGNIRVNARPGIAQFTITEETGSERLLATRPVTVAKFAADQNTLLTYDLEPRSVEISPSQDDPSFAEITVSVSNSVHVPVDCRSISFGFLKGNNAADLFNDATGIETDVESGWDIAQSGPQFTATPSSGTLGRIGSHGVPFEFKKIKVNDQVGTTGITITEVTTADVNHTGTVVKDLGKTPITLQIRDFRASPAIINEGAATTLSWEATSGATVSIEYLNENGDQVTISHVKGSTTALAATGSYAINLKSRATFHLYASLAGKSQPAHKEFEVSVTPAKPRVNSFEGSLNLAPGSNRAILKWDASHADYCELTGNDNQLGLRAEAHTIDLNGETGSQTLTLTAWDREKLHSDGRELILNWRLRELRNVATPMKLRLALSTDGSRVFVLGNENVDNSLKDFLSIFDSGTLEAIGTPTAIETNLDQNVELLTNVAIAVAHTRSKIYLVVDFALRAYDANTLQQVGTALSVGTHAGLVAVSRDETRIYVVGFDHPEGTVVVNIKLRVVDAATFQAVGDLIALHAPVACMAASPLDEHIYFGCFDSTLRVFDPGSNAFVGTPVSLPVLPSAIALSPDGKFVYIVSNDKTLRALNAATYTACVEPIALDEAPVGIVTSPDGTHLFITDALGHLRKFAAYAVYDPVRIESFTADPVLFDAGDDHNTFPVKLEWNTINATQVLLNNQPTTDKAKTVSIDKTTEFKLEARGRGGPIASSLTVRVVRPVKIDSFSASSSLLHKTGDHADVTLNWATANANQVRLNGELVTGNSKTVSISQTTRFTLEATGKNGPVSSSVDVTVKDVNLQLSRSGNTVTATFYADAGSYTVRFVFSYVQVSLFPEVPPVRGTEERSVTVSSQGFDQTTSASASAALDLRSGTMYQTVDVTVTGLSSGPITRRLNW